MHATVDTTIIRVDAHLLVADWKLVVLLLQVMLGPLGFWWFLLRQFWRPKDLCDLKFTYLFAHKDDFLISKYFSFTLHQLYHRQHHHCRTKYLYIIHKLHLQYAKDLRSWCWITSLFISEWFINDSWVTIQVSITFRLVWMSGYDYGNFTCLCSFTFTRYSKACINYYKSI